MKIIELVENGLEEFKNQKADGHGAQYLDGYLQGLLVMLDYEQTPKANELKDKIFRMQLRLL